MMKSKLLLFLAGVVTGVLLFGVAIKIPHFLPTAGSSVPMWTQGDVAAKGLSDFRKESEVLGRWDVGAISEECSSDFESMAVGRARLGLVYSVGDAKYLVLMLAVFEDEWGRDVSDRVIAYVYDIQSRKLVGKFWVGMA